MAGIAFSPDGKWLATRSWDNTARTWESDSGREVARIADRTGVIGTTFRGQEARLVTISRDYQAEVWDPPTPQEVRLNHNGPVRALAFSPDGRLLATGSDDHAARLWDTATGREVSRLAHAESVTHLAFSPDGRFLATGMMGRWYDEEQKPTTVSLWEVRNGREIARLPHPMIFTCLAFSPDGARLATGGGDGIIRLWETATGKELSQLKAAKLQDDHDNVRSLAFSPDGRRLAAGYTRNGTRVWDLETRQPVNEEKGLGTITAVGFSPDGRWVVAGGNGGSTVLLEAASGKKVADLPHDGWVETLAFSPTQPWLATGSEDFHARIWELPRGRELTRVRHGAPVTRVVFSPDGRFVASSEDCPDAPRENPPCRALVRVWEAATGVEVGQFSHEKGIDDLAFSPDGRLIASASGDGTARLWRWQPEELIRQACGRPTNNLTQAEWSQYLGREPYRPTCPGLPVTAGEKAVTAVTE